MSKTLKFLARKQVTVTCMIILYKPTKEMQINLVCMNCFYRVNVTGFSSVTKRCIKCGEKCTDNMNGSMFRVDSIKLPIICGDLSGSFRWYLEGTMVEKLLKISTENFHINDLDSLTRLQHKNSFCLYKLSIGLSGPCGGQRYASWQLQDLADEV